MLSGVIVKLLFLDFAGLLLYHNMTFLALCILGGKSERQRIEFIKTICTLVECVGRN